MRNIQKIFKNDIYITIIQKWTKQVKKYRRRDTVSTILQVLHS
jgi:hypothetical protein